MPDSKPNVLMVTRELSGDRRYGLGRSLIPVVDALINRGWRVRYLSQEDLPGPAKVGRQHWLARIERLPGIAHVEHRQRLLGALAERIQMGWFAAKTARDERFTVVHLHDPWLGFGFWVGKKVLRLREVRWGITEHGFGCYCRAIHEDGLTQGPRLQRWLRRFEAVTLGAANWVTAPTQLALDQLARDLALPFNPSHWRVIPHAAMAMPATNQTQARQQLGWSLNGFHVLGVGRLASLKRFDILAQACANLAQRYPALHLHLLGDGDPTVLQQIAEAAGFGDRIHFAVVDEVRPYLAAADVYISTSQTESFGLANFEAMLAGLPCICTAVGGVPEVMGRGAWLIPVDRAVLEGALDELVCKPELRQMLAARAALQARGAASLDWVTDQYVSIFQQ